MIVYALHQSFEGNKTNEMNEEQKKKDNGAALHRCDGIRDTFTFALLNLCRYRFVSLSGDLYENHIFFIRLFFFSSVPFSFLIEPIHNVWIY